MRAAGISLGYTGSISAYYYLSSLGLTFMFTVKKEDYEALKDFLSSRLGSKLAVREGALR
jgi:hypothetical protein